MSRHENDSAAPVKVNPRCGEVSEKRKLCKRVLFVNTVLGGALMCFLFALVYLLLRRYRQESPEVYKYYAVLLLGFLFYGFSLRSREEWKVKLASITVCLGMGIYLVEIVFSVTLRTDEKPLPEQAGAPFDSRSKLEVVTDLHRQGVDAYPAMAPEFFRDSDGLTFSNGRIYPLAGIASKVTVFCRESAEYSIYESDEHGFNNPSGLYKVGEVDVVLVGDSFVQGACVQPGEDIAGRLRGSGVRALNLGMGSDGPLSILATLTEYSLRLQPKITLWVYFEGNDLFDLLNEKQSPTLMRYLEEGFSQCLLERQDEIDRVLKNYVTDMEQQERIKHRLWKMSFSRVVKLAHLRKWLGGTEDLFDNVGELLREILAKAKERTSAKGGQLYFVYLPEWFRYTKGKTNNVDLFNRDRVLALAHRLSIPVIDFHETIVRHPDRESLWPFGRRGHYTAEGYNLLAKTIMTRLAEDGIVAPEVR